MNYDSNLPRACILVLTIAALAAGCADDGTFADLGGEADEDADGGDGDGDADGDGDGDGDADSDTGDGDGDGDGDGPEPENWPGAEWGDNLGDCVALDCGGGVCVSDGQSEACVCPQGTQFDGFSCAACTVVSDGDTFDVPTVTLAGLFRLGGQPASSGPYDFGRLVAESIDGTDRVVITDTRKSEFSTVMVPGAYVIYYELVAGGVGVPRNKRARLGTLVLIEDKEFTIDLPIAWVQGPITVNGGTPTTSQYDYGEIYLAGVQSDDVALLGETRAGAFSAMVLAGSYQVTYHRVAGGIDVPRNEWARIGEADWIIESAEVPVDLPIDVPSAHATGTFTIGGNAPPSSPYDFGRVLLRTDAGDEVLLGETRAGSYDVSIVPGDYAIDYELVVGGVGVPGNQRARLAAEQKFEPDGEGAIDEPISIPAVEISGTYSLDDAPTPTSPYERGQVWLESDQGDRVALGETHQQSYQRLVVPGDYRVMYGRIATSGVLPANTRAQIGDALSVQGPTVHDVALTSVEILGDVTVDGAPPPASPYSSGRIELVAGNDRALLGPTHLGSYGARVVPGSYDVVYAEDAAGPGVPANRTASVGAVVLDADTNFPVDVPTGAFEAMFAVDGRPMSSPASQLFLIGSAYDDQVYLGTLQSTPLSRLVVPGEYDVHYGATPQTPESLPRNTRAKIGCVVAGK